MLVCPNCNHSNPEGATQCEACYTPLPTTRSCPNCLAPVQTDASFCGQCGFNLSSSTATEAEPTVATVSPKTPDLVSPPLVQSPLSSPSPPNSMPAIPATVVSPLNILVSSSDATVPLSPPPEKSNAKTQLQQQRVKLLHVQTDTLIELSKNLSVIHLGKSNDRIPPDIDVSGFPNSEIVSRIHADIRVEADAYYIEDVGSSNGTYINNKPLSTGDRHRLRAGDRIALGKGDLVTFLFQIS